MGDWTPGVNHGSTELRDIAREYNIQGLGTDQPKEHHVYGPFENGFTVSVIRGSGSFGAVKGLWEAAVLDPEDYLIQYFDDTAVMGHLTEEAAMVIVNTVANTSFEELKKLPRSFT